MCVREKIIGLTTTRAIELQPDDRPRSNLGIKSGLDDIVGPHREFARRFTELIEKLAGNTPGDCQKKIERLITRMSEAAGLAGGLVFTQRRSVVDAGAPQEGELGSGRRSVGAEPL
ncbi:hypothetical protein B296_00022976 [Ensete ventricosum]|uniref:Uncharacterized protein n=1 Tax=Ensete ventricosum TaxID=4639 RepID=A0A426XQJ1_ENSVE|nr:hypothetical protein B296_00022976 [Ensete ventricosum]